MPSKRRLLKGCKLYLILDTSVNTYDELFEIAKKSVEGGADIIQLRDKKGEVKDIFRFSKEIQSLTKGKVLYIINDRADLVEYCQADGVHVGREDIPVSAVRKLIGKNFLVGASCQSLAHVRSAKKEGADYIGFGSVFKTPTKPQRKEMDLHLLRKAIKQGDIPIFAIGGINLNNCAALQKIGVRRVAVCRSICLAQDIGRTVREFKKILKNVK